MATADLIGKIWNEDCLDTMKRMEDKSVDLIVTDPPYGLGFDYGIFVDTPDNLKSLVDAVMPEMLRVAHRVVLTPGHTNIWLYPPAKWIMAWVYGTTNALNPWGFTSWQPILAYGKDAYLGNSMGARMDIIKDSVVSAPNGHPCPKPLTFVEKLVVRASVAATDIVYDPFLGSGTTAVACEKLGRRWIGSEINPDYCKIAEKRIRDFKAQGNLFAMEAV